jgi:hypothetical protein
MITAWLHRWMDMPAPQGYSWLCSYYVVSQTCFAALMILA